MYSTSTGNNRWIVALIQTKEGKMVSGDCIGVIKMWNTAFNQFIFTMKLFNLYLTHLIKLQDD